MKEKFIFGEGKKTPRFLGRQIFGKTVLKSSRSLEVLLKLKMWRKPACAAKNRSDSLVIFCKSLEEVIPVV